MASTCSILLISLFFSFYLPPFSHAARYPYDQPRVSIAANRPKQRAEKLIRSLNLFPKHEINKPFEEEESLVKATRIVEKPSKFRVAGSSGPSIRELGHYAGYYRLPNTKAARMFYFFFESRNSKNDPVVIWLTGGPGCSSELALFYENGPVKISDDMSLVWNDYGWDLASNIIFVDQPTGTGFSYTTDENDIRHNETGVGNDLYSFLQEFFKSHPDYVNHDFYITGESYAGHYVPAIASRINQGNKNNEGIHINLKGLAIGNGLTDPAIQYKAYTDFALDNKLINQSDYNRIKKLVPGCEQAIKACGTDGEDTCGNAYAICTEIFNEIMNVAGNINYYDIRKECEGSLCYDFSKMETLMNNATVKQALGVGNIDFVSCSSEVYDAMINDWMRDLEVGIPALLEEGIKVLVYAGAEDLICNWLGNSRWVQAMAWSGKKAFGAAPTVPFVVDGAKAGEMKTYGPLTFLKVYEAGHMVPMDQPKAALQMLKSWTQGKLALTYTKHGIGPK